MRTSCLPSPVGTSLRLQRASAREPGEASFPPPQEAADPAVRPGAQLGESPLQGQGPEGPHLSGCRPGRLLHGASALRCPWCPERLLDPPCSPSLFSTLPDWLACNPINLVGGALCQLAACPTPPRGRAAGSEGPRPRPPRRQQCRAGGGREPAGSLGPTVGPGTVRGQVQTPQDHVQEGLGQTFRVCPQEPPWLQVPTGHLAGGQQWVGWSVHRGV